MKPKRRTWKKYDVIHYTIEIRGWDLSYSFRLTGDMKDMSWPFWEHAGLEIKGSFLQPKALSGRGIEVHIIGDRRATRALERPEEPVGEPNGVGGLTVRGMQSEYIGSVPFDALQMLCVVLQAGKIKYLGLTGKPLYRGSANITSISFDQEYDPEENNA